MPPSSALNSSDATLIAAVDDAISCAVDQASLPPGLGDAVRYAVLGPGKRVRPLLVLRSFLAVSGTVENENWQDALPAAVSLELIHAFSLVHDDLPAMDDDDLRRGRPTLHRHTSEAMAILAGDVMVSLAFQVLSGATRGQDASLASKLVAELSQATTAMIAGQVRDTFGDDTHADKASRLLAVHRDKTGALLRAACVMGAISAGASADRLDALRAFADALGLMFQAVDDLLDVTSDPDTLGKATQKDADAGKLTYPGVFGIEGTRAEIARLHTQAKQALQGFPPSADPLRELADRLATRDR